MSIESSLKSIADSLAALVELKQSYPEPVIPEITPEIEERLKKAAASISAPSADQSKPVETVTTETTVAPAPPVEVPAAPPVAVPEVPAAPTQPLMTQEELNAELNEIAIALNGNGQPIFDLMNKPPFNAKGIGDLKPEQYRELVEAARKELL